MGRLMGALEHLATDSGAAVVFAHHVSKGAAREGQGDQQHAARGSSVLTDNARWAASLCRMTREESLQYKQEGHASPVGEDRRQAFVRLSLPKANYSPASADLWFERTDEGVLLPAKLISTPGPSPRTWNPTNPKGSPGRLKSGEAATGGDHDWE
jgi:RecA-family ATPase